MTLTYKMYRWLVDKELKGGRSGHVRRRCLAIFNVNPFACLL